MAEAVSSEAAKSGDGRDREIAQLRVRAALDIVGKAHALLETFSVTGTPKAAAAVINPAVDELAELTDVKRACDLLGLPRGSHYRAKRPVVYGPAPKPTRATLSNALSEAE